MSVYIKRGWLFLILFPGVFFFAISEGIKSIKDGRLDDVSWNPFKDE